jgi:integrase
MLIYLTSLLLAQANPSLVMRARDNIQHSIPLLGEALQITRRVLEERGRSGPLTVIPRGRELTSQNLAKAMEGLREGLFTEAVTPHDLRRTAATLMGRLEIDQITIGWVLNHASTTKATVTGSVYDRHSYIPQKRRALEALDGEVARAISGSASQHNIVTLPDRKR